MTATGDVSIMSNVFERANASGESISGGIVGAAGITVVTATAGGSTTTQVGGALTSTGAVTVSTKLDSATVATGRAIGASFGFVGQGLVTSATTDPTANTTVGGSVGGHDLVQVTSTVTSDASATADAFSVSLGVTAAAAFVTATNAPSVTATAKGASSSANDVVIYAVNNYTGSVYPLLGSSDSFNGKGAHASATQVDVGGLSMGALKVTATDDSSVAAGIAAHGNASVAGALVIAARSPHTAIPTVTMVNVGLAGGASGLSSTLNVGGDVAAYVDDGATVSAAGRQRHGGRLEHGDLDREELWHRRRA